MGERERERGRDGMDEQMTDKSYPDMVSDY